MKNANDLYGRWLGIQAEKRLRNKQSKSLKSTEQNEDDEVFDTEIFVPRLHKRNQRFLCMAARKKKKKNVSKNSFHDLHCYVVQGYLRAR